MSWYTITTMVKINLAIILLSKLCNFRLPRVLNNPCGLIRMLNVDEGAMLVTTIENSADPICSAYSEREIHTRISFKQREDRAFVPERESRILQQCEVCVKRMTHVLLAPKCENRILPISERDACVSNSKRETRVLSQT